MTARRWPRRCAPLKIEDPADGRNVDPRLLNTLISVLRHGSMTAAAAALGYVPSAVSQQMSRLERQVGVELLSRRPGGGVSPTAAGRALADGAAGVLAAAADFRRLVDVVAGSGVPEVRIGVYPSAASRLLPTVLAELRAAHPGTVLRLLELEPAQGLRVLRTGEIDVQLAYRYMPEDPPVAAEDLRFIGLGREPLWLLTAAGSSATLDACAAADWAAGHPGRADRRLLDRWAHQHGLNPAIRYETDDYHTVLALIVQGLAVGLVPASVAAPQLGALARIPAPGLDREVLAVTRARSRHPVVDELAGLLRASITRAAAAA
ncbi:LysR family transcriptional regulator [Streptomyces sp. GC420]|uniref:LysR family transcriptional regulator n=1 Tax=Streptomyces sp. GC420 TaxID=2697568 RepID=UPI00141516AE|nr:LysR family transcriptional regulator [Streptomyces sp. GC420]NBM15562.1 LysR family transcriptional regulator [Streptomyces sp. GC420]